VTGKAAHSSTSALLAAFQAAESGLKQYIMRFVVREQDVEDILQETFLRACEYGLSRRVRSPKSFLFRVAHNIALSELARKSRRLTVFVGDMTTLNVIDDRPSAEQELEIHRRLESLGATIGALPPRCQRVLVMRKIFGFSYKEIARRMDISVRTVEKHLETALQRCQERDRAASTHPETEHGGPARGVRSGAGDD
jgi:RNA polymerase sigma factor (sigma-70 family)